MGFIKMMAKAGVWYFVGTAATTAGLIAGFAAIAPALPVIEEKSTKFFSRFKEEKEES